MKTRRFAFALIAIPLLAACQGRPGPSAAGYTDLRPQALATMLEAKDFWFVNVHIPYEGEIAGTDAFLPYNELDAHAGELPADRDAKIVLYCRSGRMSAIAADELVAKGYTQVYNLDGGMIAWEAAGLPIEHR